MSVEQIEQNRAVALGNTDTTATAQENKKKQSPQANYWNFTFNNYEMHDIEHLEQILRHECGWYVFQEEVGELTGTPHLQGTLYFKQRKRLSEIKKIDQKISWSITKKIKASIVYCTKLETRAGRIFYYGINIPEDIRIEEPRGWQLDVINIVDQQIPDPRTIHWFWEPRGGVGKTELCKYLVVRRKALVVSGKSNDMFYAIIKNPERRKIILVDVPRSTQDFINYGAIESIKNGLIFSGKYESNLLAFNSPHVIVFANEMPDMEKLSFDRWHIVRINPEDPRTEEYERMQRHITISQFRNEIDYEFRNDSDDELETRLVSN